MPKTIGAARDFIDKGQCVALSHDNIKVGCRDFSRGVVNSHRMLGNHVFILRKEPYWVTKEDCDYLLKLMDKYEESVKPRFKAGMRFAPAHFRTQKLTLKEFREEPVGGITSEGWTTEELPDVVLYFYYDEKPLEDKPQPKFKVGDWVRCTSSSHIDANPYKITSLTDNGFYGGGVDYIGFGCREEDLELVAPLSPKRFTGEHWKVTEAHAASRLAPVTTTSPTEKCLLDIRTAIEELAQKIEK